VGRIIASVRTTRQLLQACVAKIVEDDIVLLASMLAFNLLMSLVPILVLILVFFGFFLNDLTPHVKDHLIATLSATFSHGAFVKLALYQLTNMAIWPVVIIVVIPSIWFGSEFFVAIELCFSRIYHIRPRVFLRQRLLALQMLGIFILLIPLLVIVSTLPTQIKRNSIQAIFGTSPWAQVIFLIIDILTGWLVASAFFFIIYLVVPRYHARQVWKGALMAGALLTIYGVAFPLLVSGDLRAKNEALNAGFALAVLGFFYFFSIFLLLGAEFNAWNAREINQRQSLTQGNTSAGGTTPR